MGRLQYRYIWRGDPLVRPGNAGLAVALSVYGDVTGRTSSFPSLYPEFASSHLAEPAALAESDERRQQQLTPSVVGAYLVLSLRLAVRAHTVRLGVAACTAACGGDDRHGDRLSNGSSFPPFTKPPMREQIRLLKKSPHL